MKKLSIQFHATVEELVEFSNFASSEIGLNVTIMITRPFALKEIGGELSVDDFMPDGDVRVIFTKEQPNINASSPNKFYDLNPGTVDLDIGRLTEKGLKESALSFMSNDEEKIVIANKLASRLKKVTKAGPIGVSTINGIEAKCRNHRYTKGAKTKYEEGVKILSLSEVVYYQLLD